MQDRRVRLVVEGNLSQFDAAGEWGQIDRVRGISEGRAGVGPIRACLLMAPPA